MLLELRHRWADGTKYLLFDPIELLERLAALTPRPRINLVLYYGVLAARAAWRARLGGPETTESPHETAASAEPDTHSVEPGAVAVSATRSRSNLLWAQLLHRSFGFDAGAPAARAVRGGVGCAGLPAVRRLRLIALIEDPAVIRRMLRHLNLPTEVPGARPSRKPPLPFGAFRGQVEDDFAAP